MRKKQGERDRLIQQAVFVDHLKSVLKPGWSWSSIPAERAFNALSTDVALGTIQRALSASMWSFFLARYEREAGKAVPEPIVSAGAYFARRVIGRYLELNDRWTENHLDGIHRPSVGKALKYIDATKLLAPDERDEVCNDTMKGLFKALAQKDVENDQALIGTLAQKIAFYKVMSKYEKVKAKKNVTRNAEDYDAYLARRIAFEEENSHLNEDVTKNHHGDHETVDYNYDRLNLRERANGANDRSITRQLLKRLGGDCEKILTLFYVKGKTSKEIGATMEKAADSIRHKKKNCLKDFSLLLTGFENTSNDD